MSDTGDWVDHRAIDANGERIGPKDTGDPNYMGITKGGKYVLLGNLDAAQAEEDAAEAVSTARQGEEMQREAQRQQLTRSTQRNKS